MKILARKNIQQITPYKAGKPIEETKRELRLKEVIKLASNENPFGPSLKAVAAIKRFASSVNRYPDSNSFYLKKALARQLRLTPERLVLGNGSDELIDIIIKAFVEESESVLTSKVTFLEYEIIAKTNNRPVVTVPLRNFKYDLQALAKKINARTKVVFIANPNNPTGTYVNAREVKDFFKEVPEDVLVVFDEAYDTFIDVNDFPAASFLLSQKNCIILRTFSKAYGLAGLRIGYAIASPRIASFMEKTRQPFNVNLLAQVAAEAALSDTSFLKKTRDTILKEKEYLYKSLSKMSVEIIPSVANFILIDARENGVALFKKMLAQGVIVRDMQQYGLDTFIRVTIGTHYENQRFIHALKKTLKNKI